MSSDAYSEKNIYRYSRKTYKNDANSSINAFTERGVEVRNNNATLLPVCSCDVDSKEIFDGILHKKCPILALAHQQRQRIADETDRLFYNSGTHSRSLYNFLMFIRDVVIGKNRQVCIQGILLTITFIVGIVLGSASCGTHLRKFNSAVFACIDHILADDSRKVTDDSTAIY